MVIPMSPRDYSSYVVCTRCQKLLAQDLGDLLKITKDVYVRMRIRLYCGCGQYWDWSPKKKQKEIA